MLNDWQFTPEIVVTLLLVAGLYANGLRRRSSAPRRDVRQWRVRSFFTGLLAIYVALESPLDALSDRLFFVHQIQHLTMMIVAPFLLMEAAPESVLTAGIPRIARRYVLAPIVRNRIVGRVFAFLAHPATATVLAGGTLYFWMVPEMFNAALVDERIHYLMHMTMLIGGLFFWWRVLDRRRPPAGIPYPVRVGMLMVNFMMLALLGAFLASNDRVLYRGDEDLRLLGITPLADERIGGMVLWLAGGALLMVAIAVTFRRWVREMERASPVNPG